MIRSSGPGGSLITGCMSLANGVRIGAKLMAHRG